MIYSWACDYCGHLTDVAASVARRNDPVRCCVCGRDMRRRYVPAQLITQPIHRSDLWTDGLSATDRQARDRDDDRAYERAWQPSPPEGPFETVGTRR